MTASLDTLQAALEGALGERAVRLVRDRGELTLTVRAEGYRDTMVMLRDHPELGFDQLIDLCGLDYSTWRDATWDGARFAVVSHLLSLQRNHRVRVKVFAPDDDVPVVASVTDVWGAANWFEREAFDLFGIVFDGPCRTCGASSPTTASSGIRSARTSRCRARRDAVRPGAPARDLPARDDRAARDRPAGDPGRELRRAPVSH